MIPIVTDIAAAAPLENKPSESLRTVAMPVDRFSEHLRKPKIVRHEKDRSPSAKPDAPPPAKAKPDRRRAEYPSAKDPVSPPASENESEIKKEKSPESNLQDREVRAWIANVTPAAPIEVVIAPTADGQPTAAVEADLELLPLGEAPEQPLNALVQLPSESTGAILPDPASNASIPFDLTSVHDASPTLEPQTELIPLEEKSPDLAATPELELVTKLEPIANPSDRITVVEAPISLAQNGATPSAEAAALQEIGQAKAEVPEIAQEIDLEIQAIPAESPTKKIQPAPSTTFAKYVFGEANSSADSKPREVDLASMLSEDSRGEKEEGEEARDSDSKSPHEVRAERIEPTPLLTPVDAAQSAASTLPLSLRRHLESQNAAAPPGPSAGFITDTQHARLLQRVTRAFQAAHDRGGEVQIRLSPPELGSMKLELSLSQGVLTAKLEVESQRAQSILLDSLPNLKERLSEQGIRIEKFDVNLPQRDSGGQQPREQPSQRQFHGSAAPTRQSGEAGVVENTPSRSSIADASRLNVMV
jgi:flagellar hook-length control protein FliK